jgi:micrococcal nuclease
MTRQNATANLFKRVDYLKSTLTIFILLCITLSANSCKSAKITNEQQYYAVKKVVDGDTFWIDDGSPKGVKVRLIGVDAPESRRTARKEIGFYGKEAKQFLESFLQNKRVRLEYDVNMYDQYMRVLAYAYLEDGTFLNAYLVENGYAMVLTVPPNVKHSELFLKLQQSARIRNKGLWGK